MKAAEYYASLALSVVVVVLAVLVFFTSRSTQNLQVTLNSQQEEINKGSMSQQVGANLLRDTAQLALTNVRIKELLQRNGITVTPNQPATNAVPTKK